jgi:hypothetical protein
MTPNRNHIAGGNHRFSQAAGAAAGPYRPTVNQDPEMAELHHRGRGRRGELRAMIKIDIFKENHRFAD